MFIFIIWTQREQMSFKLDRFGKFILPLDKNEQKKKEIHVKWIDEYSLLKLIARR